MRGNANTRKQGDYLYQLRIERNLTLQSAAEMMHINKSTLCRIEQGAILRLSARVREGLCAAYGITQQDLQDMNDPNVSRIGSVETGAECDKAMRLVPMTDQDFFALYHTLDLKSRLRVQNMARITAGK